MKPAAMLLLLAVAASQVDLADLSQASDILNTGFVNISTCPITYYGRTYSLLDVKTEGTFSKFCFQNDPSEALEDCFLLAGNPSDKVTYEVKATNPTQQSTIQAKLPNMVSSSGCSYELIVTNGGSLVATLTLFPFETQTALSVFLYGADVTVNTTVNFISMDFRNFTYPNSPITYYMDLSGCRVSDVAAVVNSSKLIPGSCSKIVCDIYANTSTVSTCGALETCWNNDTCLAIPEVCTVTGSSVIDFFGRVHSIPDRCTYTLMRNPSVEVKAAFAERRRTDVPFLSNIEIEQIGAGVSLLLEPGGRVWDKLAEKMITLSTTTQMIQGVELSKDPTGVTAKMPFTNMTLFFDGTTAHISGLTEDLDGLCGNLTDPNVTTTPSAQRLSSSPNDECRIQHSDAVDSTINCNRSTEHCDLMRQAPFTACHNDIDPEPYITACTNTLCNYPTVDALNCQLLEAYAKACYLKVNITLEDWRSTAGCAAVPQDFCQDAHCSHHEFCGETLGVTGCLCRALFAAKYKPTNALGEPAVCMQNSATITLAGCLLKEKSIDYSVLHLKDPSCTGHMDDQTHMITFSFNSSNNCGTEVLTNNSKVIYQNTITVRNSTFSGVITRHDQVEIDFSCFYQMPDIRSVSFRIKDSSVVQKIVSGVWNYTLIMTAYTDPGLSQLIKPSTEIQLNQKIWLKLDAKELDDNMVVIVTDSCWATSQPSPGSSPRYDLVINKCPNPKDQTVLMEGNGQGTSNFFSFNMFEFSGQSSEIYLHCQVELCPTRGPTCVPTCGGGAGRRRRSFQSKGGNPSGLITMVWSN